MLVSCDRPGDDHAVLRSEVLSCIVDGGGTLGQEADVAIAGGKAVAVLGPVQANEALISECLDLANS